MADLINTSEFINKYSDNLMLKSSRLKDASINVLDGSGFLTSIKNDAYYGNFANIINTDYNTNDFTFNFGDALTTPITKDGLYQLQFSMYHDSLDINYYFPFFFGVNVFKNGFLDSTITGTMVENISDNLKKTITFSQSINCASVTELDFSFTIFTDSEFISSNQTLNIGNFKLEYATKDIGTPTPYSLPIDYYSSLEDLHISETQWDVTDVGPQVIANGGFINLLTLINNVTHKNLTNSDTYDQLNIISNAIKTTYRGNKIIHTIRVSFNVIAGTDQFYQLQIRRKIDDSVVYRCQLQRNADETIQTAEMTTRTLSAVDPFVVDGFYLAFVNNSGASATIDDALSVVIISHYQKGQKTT